MGAPQLALHLVQNAVGRLAQLAPDGLGGDIGILAGHVAMGGEAPAVLGQRELKPRDLAELRCHPLAAFLDGFPKILFPRQIPEVHQYRRALSH